MRNEFHTIGLMSGTSLDGLDIAYVKFIHDNNNWSFSVDIAETHNYSANIRERLYNAHKLNTKDFLILHNYYGEYTGDVVNKFIVKNNIPVDFIASHGHTIFHQPQNKFTFQIGSGASICAKTKITTISDFRTLDVALGGNGAPLVPIGDLHLFPTYKYCLNLGGFANISIKKDENIYAYDIAPCNFALNYLTQQIGKEFDKNGEIAQEGIFDDNLLNKLNSIEYFHKNPPKSLGREWFENIYKPNLDNINISITDKLNTVVENISDQIIKQLDNNPKSSVLITGGGTYNKYLIDKITQKTNNNIVLPEDKIIDFKEALIFAYLGLLKFTNKLNTLKSVTGAEKNSIGGIIHSI
jgi:anhydro-N-acetylmuramic acid kinase